MPFPQVPRTPRVRRSKRSSAARSVLSTPEVLQIILLELPTEDILVNAQRVNRDFRDAIANLPFIQQKLVFSPSRLTHRRKLSPTHLFENLSRLSSMTRRKNSKTFKDGLEEYNVGNETTDRIKILLQQSRYVATRTQKSFFKKLSCEPVYVRTTQIHW
jgi:hypothetical protein